MTTPMRNRMRRQTRPAKYMSRSCQAESASWGRPGGRSFSFTGEFPEMYDTQPVEVKSRRRTYTAPGNTGIYQAVRQDDTHRMPVINKHGVHVVTAVAMFALLFAVLSGIVGTQLAQRSEVLNAISVKEDRISVLSSECNSTRSAIAAQSNDMNIRQEAVRMGLISSKGVAVEYLEGPKDAVITLKDQNVLQSLAAIWGQ